jgi:hypothetical protein
MFFLHAGLMMTGLLLMSFGFFTAHFLKTKRWWMKTHKRLEITGTVCLLCGLAAAILMVAQHHGPHFSALHTYLGFVTVLLTVSMLALGILIFQLKPMLLRLKALHRWSGRVTLVTAWVTAFMGMILAGIV